MLLSYAHLKHLPSIIYTYSELRQSQIENNQSLEEIVKREPVEKNIRKVFSHLKETNNGPISQPLLIIGLIDSFDSLERSIS